MVKLKMGKIIAPHQIIGVSEIEIKSQLQLWDLLAIVHLSQLEALLSRCVFLVLSLCQNVPKSGDQLSEWLAVW